MLLRPVNTATDLVGAFNSLPEQEKRTFIRWLYQAVPPTAEELIRLLNAAPEHERRVFYRQLWEQVFKPSLPTEQIIHQKLNEVVLPQVEAIRLQDKKTRDAKPRNAERDAAIVRLRDEEHLSFGEIPRRLKTINPAWGVNERGRPLTRDAVEAAYRAWKNKHPQGENSVPPYQHTTN